MSITPDQVMPSRAPPRNRRWRTISSCRPPPSLVAFTSPHPLRNVVDGVQDALRVGDRQLFTEVQLLDECVGRNLYALLVARVDTCHHHSVLSILRCLADAAGPGGVRGLIRSSNRRHPAVTARNARTRSSSPAHGPGHAHVVTARQSVSAAEFGCFPESG